MKIGLDARFLTHPQVGGFKTYTVNLVRALAQVDSRNEYVLYVDRPLSENSLRLPGNFRYRVVSTAVPILGLPIREQLSLVVLAKRDRLDVVHSLCNTAAAMMQTPHIVTLHDTIQLSAPRGLRIRSGPREWKRWANLCYSHWAINTATPRACIVVTVSDYEKSLIHRTLGIPLHHISVTHLAPDAAFFPADTRERERLREWASRDFGVSGRFIMGVGYEPRKNIPLLIRAFAALPGMERSLSLVIVAAQRDARQSFRNLASQLGLGRSVIVLSALSPQELAVLYNLAEILVFPSERESFGLPPLEAMACGTPVVAADSSSLREIVGDAGLLVPIGQPDGHTALVDGIHRVLADPGLKVTLSEKGLQRARAFSWRRCAEETVELYEARSARRVPLAVPTGSSDY